MKSYFLRIFVLLLISVLFVLPLGCSDDPNPIEQTLSAPPVVNIGGLAAGDYLLYYFGDTVYLNGTAFDQEDGELIDSSLVWTSDYDGVLGYGSSIQVSNLSVNAHLIILTAVDNDGVVGADTINVAILNYIELTINLTAPLDNAIFTVGDTITFQGNAIDPEDGVLSGNLLEWTSDKDQRLGTGVSFITANLSVNTHLIRLTATDKDNNSIDTSITITVVDN